MSQRIDLLQTQLTPKQKNELLAAYEDYFYFSRKLEELVKNSSTRALAYGQLKLLYNDIDFRKLDIPWRLRPLSAQEQENYMDFINENIHTDEGFAYLSLQHTDPEQDYSTPIGYVPPSYLLTPMNIEFPCTVERYLLAYPRDRLIGNTKFLIDGRYKAFYILKENAEVPIAELFKNPNIQAEFRMLVNMIDIADNKRIVETSDFMPHFYELCASEFIATTENKVLETLGSFAEKIQDISRNVYGGRFNNNPLKSAEQNQLIPSAADFLDYINIRHLMRHQWDSMDGLGGSDLSAKEKSKQMRASYLVSYRRLCDKPVQQRTDAYIGILKQMQKVIARTHPNILQRQEGESNSKFISRVKEFHHAHPQLPVHVITDYTLYDDKREPLINNLNKIFTKQGVELKVVDHIDKNNPKYKDIEYDYMCRGGYLNAYSNLECFMMTYCLTRGEHLRHQAAWDYMRRHKFLSYDEAQEWQRYTMLRNRLSHDYYDLNLRQKVKEVEQSFLGSVNTLEQRITEAYPYMEWVDRNICQCIHPDGKRVFINTKTDEILATTYRANTELSELLENKPQTPQEIKPQTNYKPRSGMSKQSRYTETYANGMEIVTSGKFLVRFKMPNGILVNFEKQRIVWPGELKFYSEAEKFNVLKTERAKIFTDKKLKVTNFLDKGCSQPIRRNDMYVVDYKHRFKTDSGTRLNEFLFKTDEGKMITARFSAVNNKIEVLFPDQTKVIFGQEGVQVTHGGQTLSFANRKAFAATYSQTSILPPNNSHTGGGR